MYSCTPQGHPEGPYSNTPYSETLGGGGVLQYSYSGAPEGGAYSNTPYSQARQGAAYSLLHTPYQGLIIQPTLLCTRNRQRVVPRVVCSRLFTLALHTHSRAYPRAPKPPWLGGGSGRTGQAAGVSWLTDLLPSEP